MTNRVDEPSSSQPTTHTDGGVESSETDEVGEASEGESVEGTDETRQTGATEDVWEKATTPYGGFMDDPTPQGADAERVSTEEGMAVWEMRAGDGASEPGGTDGTTEGEQFELNDNSVANKMAHMYDQLVEGDFYASDFGTEFNIQVFDDLSYSGREELIELAGHTDELQEALLERGGDEDLAQTVADEIESRAVSLAGERIADRARPHIQEALEAVQNNNHSSECRRSFLASTAMGAEDTEDIEQALLDLGVSPSAAEDMAEQLGDIAADDEAMASFVRGEEGADRMMGLAAGEFGALESDFADELDSIEQGLESLDRSLDRDQIQHDRFLTDPTVAPFRDEVLDEMGAVTHPPDEVNGLGEVFIEATEDSESAQTWESRAETATMIAGGAVAGVATGGTALPALSAAAGGAAGSGLQELPNVADAGLDVDRAQGEFAADMATKELVETAESDERRAQAVALGSVLVGGAVGSAGLEGVAAAGAGAAEEGGTSIVGDAVTRDRE